MRAGVLCSLPDLLVRTQWLTRRTARSDGVSFLFLMVVASATSKQLRCHR